MTTRASKPSHGASEPQRGSARGEAPSVDSVVRSHLRAGWWALLLFLSTGLVLEFMHARKEQWYINVANETRRLMFTLGHAHGTLFALINIVFALALMAMPWWTGTSRTLASRSLLAALVLLPAGFFLAGVTVYGGDPGLGIVLVPLGGILMILGVFLTARAASRREH